MAATPKAALSPVIRCAIIDSGRVIGYPVTSHHVSISTVPASAETFLYHRKMNESARGNSRDETDALGSVVGPART